MVMIVPTARTVAEPVDCVNHQINPNPARLLPNSESACPVQIVKKRSFQFVLSAIAYLQLLPKLPIV
jgi:hypothetical protein